MKKTGIFILMLLCTSMQAINYSWSAGGGANTTYTTLTNWSPTPPTGGPGNGDIATVGSSYVVGITASTMIPNGVNLTFNDGSKLLRNSVSSVAIGTGTTLNFNNNASMTCSQISLAGTAVLNWNTKGSWTTAGGSTAAFFAVTAATANTDVTVNMSDGLWDLSGNSATESFSMQAGTFNMTGGKVVNEDGFKLGSGTTSAIFNFSGNSEFYTSSAFSIFGTNSRFNFGGGNAALYIEGTTVSTTGTGGFAPLYTRINQGLVYIDNVQQKNPAFFDRTVVTVSGKSYVKITALTTPTYKWIGAGTTTLYTNTGNWDTSVSGGPGAGSTALIGSGFTIELGTAATVAANITGAGSIIKTQTGITTLSGTNTYTGSTQISAGTLLVTGSLTGTSFIRVDGGAGLTNLTTLPFA